MLSLVSDEFVQVQPAIRRMTGHRVEFVDGRSEDFDAIVLATGYRSNVPSWLKVNKHVIIFVRDHVLNFYQISLTKK